MNKNNEEEINRQAEEFERKENERLKLESNIQKFAPIIRQFSNAVNTFNYGDSAEGFAKAFSHEHRTLQQSMMRTMLAAIEYAASDEYHTDPRNEDTKKIAQAILEGFNQVMESRHGKITGGWLPSKSLGTV